MPLFILIFLLCLLPSPSYPQPKAIAVDIKSGTGFFVTPRHVVTNQHVVDGCQQIIVRGAIPPSTATLLATDNSMDLALLKTDTPSPRTAYLRSNPGLKPGDIVHIIGYPGERAQTGQYLLNQATVTDPNFYFNGITGIQFTDAVRQGNSGGPLLDYAGNVIGVIVATLSYYKNDASGARKQPYQIRGVAIGLPILKQFLKTQDVFVTETSTYDIFSDPRPDERAKEYTVNVLCITQGR